MANIITVTSQSLGQTPPSKLQDVGVESILEVDNYTDTNYPFIKSVITTINPNLSKVYCNETLQELLDLIDPQPALNPNLVIGTINPMIVGDADQLLSFTSLSSGAVTYTSSDVTKATIVGTGPYYVHAVANGDVTITAHQVASGIYASATSPGDLTIGIVFLITTEGDNLITTEGDFLIAS